MDFLNNNSSLHNGIDPLTQILNRDSFTQSLEDIKLGNLLLIDIDKFKNINNLYGITSGDSVLIQTAQFLQKFAKQREYKLYRVGSNEFALLDDNAHKDLEDIYEDIQDLIEDIAQNSIYLKTIHEHLNVHVTIGFATSTRMLMEQASAALEYAKEHYLKFSAYSNLTSNTKNLEDYIYWNDEIKKAIENNNIKPFFQPIVDKKGKIVKYEVLMRLVQENERRTLYISPVQFLNIAVQTKKYDELSKIIIFNALQILKANDKSFSINFAYQDIKNKELLNELYHFLKTNLDVAKRCTFEILENQFVENSQLLLAFVTQVREYGVKIAIDDFGSGFSNFELILLIQPDIIKIDGSLIKNVDIDSKSLTLVEAITAFSHKMGIKVVAEYVHSKAVYGALNATDIDMYQGYYFSEPVSVLE